MKHNVERNLRDFDEQLKIFNHLKAVMEVDGKSKEGEAYYKYKPEWSDARVADRFNFDTNQITRFRQKRGLCFNPASFAVDNITPRLKQVAEFAGDIAEIHLLLTRLGVTVSEHAKAITRLEETLTKPKWQNLGDMKVNTPATTTKGNQ